MPNDLIEGAAEGMPTISRRSILAHVAVAITGGAAVALAVPNMDARAAAVHDPMLDLIKQHRDANTVYNAGILSGDDDKVDEFHKTYVDPIREAIAERPPVTTEEGAREAIREALSEFTICDQFTKSLLLSALAFLDGRAAQ